jgi:hypothetical protein
MDAGAGDSFTLFCHRWKLEISMESLRQNSRVLIPLFAQRARISRHSCSDRRTLPFAMTCMLASF